MSWPNRNNGLRFGERDACNDSVGKQLSLFRKPVFRLKALPDVLHKRELLRETMAGGVTLIEIMNELNFHSSKLRSPMSETR